ncbi:MAG TPA: hypothetical protein VKP69_20020, partial [Isosphaeraceae bacterium]|nr:hypothetical protein [Isosphaeraceae bacterium]
TFDQVEGNSEKMQRGCAEKGFGDFNRILDRRAIRKAQRATQRLYPLRAAGRERHNCSKGKSS